METKISHSFEFNIQRISSSQNFTHLFPVDDLYYVYKIRGIQSVMPWILVTFGLIGNLFVLGVFLRKRTKTSANSRISSNAFCFCALAVADSFALLFMLFRTLMAMQLISNLTIACKLLKFTYYSSLQISSWCLVLLTLDRLIAIGFVFKYNSWTKLFLARKLLIAIILGVIFINFHLLIFVGSQLGDEDFNIFTTTRKTPNIITVTTPKSKYMPNYICSASNHRWYNRFIYSNWDIFHAIIYGGLPFIIIFVSNIYIVVKLVAYKKRRIIKTSNTKPDGSEKFKSFQITVMLLSVATIFLLFTGPISIYMTFFYNNLTSMRESKRAFIRVILTNLAYCNNAINFYAYMCLSSEFRKEWIKMILDVFYCFKYCRPKNISSVCTTSTTLGSDDRLNEAKSKKPYDRPDKKPMYNQDSSELPSNQPFIERDALETFKENTKNKKLIYYKSKNRPTDNSNKNNNNFNEESEQSSFINPNSTFV